MSCSRADFVRAMETLARSINDEDIFEVWLTNGVADGDIDGTETDEDLAWYCEDDNFRDLMALFTWVMTRASRSGGIYFDGICSDDSHR